MIPSNGPPPSNIMPPNGAPPNGFVPSNNPGVLPHNDMQTPGMIQPPSAPSGMDPNGGPQNGELLPNGAQLFHDTLGSEVEESWERCIDNTAPNQLAQLELLGDPGMMEQKEQSDFTTYKFSF